MPLELCRVTTEDGLQLDGSYAAPSSSVVGSTDAFLLVHGTGSNFYAPGVLEEFARLAVESGSAVLRINTRGHDGLCSIPATKGSVRGGAAYESLSECPLDLTAWVEFLVEKGHSRIAFVGHSSGAVKVLYTAAHRPHPAVVAVIGISPPRFNHEHLRQHPDFCNEYDHAKQLVDAGQGAALVQMSQPMPLLIAAERAVHKYGPANPYDFTRVLGQTTVPTLILVGTKSVESSLAFQGIPDAVRALQLPLVELQTVEGANINYSGSITAPWERAAAWLAMPKLGFEK